MTSLRRQVNHVLFLSFISFSQKCAVVFHATGGGRQKDRNEGGGNRLRGGDPTLPPKHKPTIPATPLTAVIVHAVGAVVILGRMCGKAMMMTRMTSDHDKEEEQWQ